MNGFFRGRDTEKWSLMCALHSKSDSDFFIFGNDIFYFPSDVRKSAAHHIDYFEISARPPHWFRAARYIKNCFS